MDTKLLFVCLGNICRSPAAQGIMERLIAEERMENRISVDSAGTYGGHQGELPDARMRAHASRRGLTLTHRSRKVRPDDFESFDFIVAMDDRNYQDLMNLAPDLESQDKIFRMTDFCDKPVFDHIPDPYYTGAEGFELVLDMLEDACRGLLRELKQRD